MRLLRIAVVAVCASLGALAPVAVPAATVATAPLEGRALGDALRRGGYVLYFRHASTDFGQSDETMTSFEDCNAQRNLTDKGRDLWYVVTAMRQWGDRWSAPNGAPLKMRHKACGRIVRAVPVCSHCGEPLDARSVTGLPGPGAAEGDFDRTLLAVAKD